MGKHVNPWVTFKKSSQFCFQLCSVVEVHTKDFVTEFNMDPK